MKKRECYISLARIIAAFAVVLIHTNANSCWEFDEYNCWHLGNILDCLCSFAVPLFMMISGATLIDYSERYSTKDYLKRRVNKVLIPYIAWSLFGIVFEGIFDLTGISFIYYFFLNLFGVYLAIPMFAFIKQEYKGKIIKYLIVISFVINYLLPFLSNYFGFNYTYKIPFDVAGGYLIYVLIGYWIGQNDLSTFVRVLSYVFGIIGVVMQYVLSLDIGVVDNPYRAYTALPCLLYTIGMFVFIKSIGNKVKNTKCINFMQDISGYTFPIYLLHWYVIVLINKYDEIIWHSGITRVVIVIITISICVFVTYILRKIPIIKRMLP